MPRKTDRLQHLSDLNIREISCFRMLPFRFKSWYLAILLMGNANAANVESEQTLFPLLAEREIDNGLDLTLQVYHTAGAHLPVTVDADGNRVRSGTRENYRGYVGQAHYKLRLLGEVLETLRKRKLYDVSTIIVCADHGARMPDDGEPGVERPSERAHPVLMVKCEEGRGDYAADPRPTSHSRIAALLRRLRSERLSSEQVGDVLRQSPRTYYESGRKWTVR